jgi:hypothetical protein
VKFGRLLQIGRPHQTCIGPAVGVRLRRRPFYIAPTRPADLVEGGRRRRPLSVIVTLMVSSKLDRQIPHGPSWGLRRRARPPRPSVTTGCQLENSSVTGGARRGTYEIGLGATVGHFSSGYPAIHHLAIISHPLPSLSDRHLLSAVSATRPTSAAIVAPTYPIAD